MHKRNLPKDALAEAGIPLSVNNYTVIENTKCGT